MAVTMAKRGSGTIYTVSPVRCASGTAGASFQFTEKITDSLDPRFDGILNLGITMNHYTNNQNQNNSWLWSGFSKQAKRIEKLYLLKGFISIDEPSSEDGTYTQVKCCMSQTDYSKLYFPDGGDEGVLLYGWSRNFYNSDGIADQNTLSYWNGAAEIQMSQKLRAAVENHFAVWNMQSPMTYDYGDCPIPCSKPLLFAHLSDGNVSPHPQYVMMRAIFGVKFWQRKRWWKSL